MARGNSGRIVLEVDPKEKQAIYAALAKEGLTLKDWFLGQARLHLSGHDQIDLIPVAEDASPYGSRQLVSGKERE